jgi:hypothetical protein
MLKADGRFAPFLAKQYSLLRFTPIRSDWGRLGPIDADLSGLPPPFFPLLLAGRVNHEKENSLRFWRLLCALTGGT